jgi:universal stress protein A
VLTVPRRTVEAHQRPHVTFATIVCAIDRSTASRRALEYAVSLAEEAGGRLILVHAIEDLSEEDPRHAAHFNTPDCLREIAPQIQNEYDALLPEDLRARLGLEVQVRQGKAYREVLAVSRECGAELIVLGSAGSSMPFGSTAQHVLRQAECPVLAVPPV